MRWGGGVVHKRGLGYLSTAEPPVVVIRVLRVIEAPIGRGFALSHHSMLTLTCESLAIRSRSTAFAVVSVRRPWPRCLTLLPRVRSDCPIRTAAVT